MKVIRNILIITGLLCFIYFLQTTYSKYKDNITGATNIDIAGWEIVVNDQSIKNKETLTQNITPVLPGNEYIAENVIAPGAEGYYDIIINCNKVDVDFNYKLTVSTPDDIKDLIITGYEINPSDDTKINEYENFISEDVDYTTNKIIIRIHIKWNDDETSTMNNFADTDVAINSESIKINNEIEFNQIKK